MATVVVFNTTVPLSDIPTPLVFVTPHQAFSLSLAIYIHIGSTTVLIWDILNNLRNDIRMVRSSRLGLPTFLYFITRATLLAFAVGKAVLSTSTIENCAKFETALNGILIVFVSCTTLLFYIRVCAVYLFNRYIVAFFGAVWLITVATCITFPFTFVAENIGQTQFCLQKIRGPFLALSSIVLLVNEVLTYLAITYRIYRLYLRSNTSLKQRMNLVIFGRSLPVLWKVLLQDSQLYCLAIVMSKVFLVIINSTVQGFDPPASIMFIITHLVLINILACRVHRNLRRDHDAMEASVLNGELASLHFTSTTAVPQDDGVDNLSKPSFGTSPSLEWTPYILPHTPPNHSTTSTEKSPSLELPRFRRT